LFSYSCLPSSITKKDVGGYLPASSINLTILTFKICQYFKTLRVDC
jgi:hypothetical protein